MTTEGQAIEAPAGLDASDTTTPRRPKLPKKTRRRLYLRRSLALGLILGVVGGLYYIVVKTDLADPIFALIPPVQEFIAWCVEDPKRAWGAASVLLVSNIGLYAAWEKLQGKG